jgi:hypothetical protein
VPALAGGGATPWAGALAGDGALAHPDASSVPVTSAIETARMGATLR